MLWGSSYVAAALALAVAAPPHQHVLDDGLLSPLSVAVAADGGIWYSENYAGLLHHRAPDGTVTTPVHAPGDLEVAAVSELGGTVYYSVTGAGHTIGRLHERSADGQDRVVADLYAHEKSANPDHEYTYGFRDLPAGCTPKGPRVSYRGRAETHPVASLPAHGAASATYTAP